MSLSILKYTKHSEIDTLDVEKNSVYLTKSAPYAVATANIILALHKINVFFELKDVNFYAFQFFDNLRTCLVPPTKKETVPFDCRLHIYKLIYKN